MSIIKIQISVCVTKVAVQSDTIYELCINNKKKVMFNLFKSIMGSGNEQLATVIKEGAFLVDVRTPEEFAGGSVKGAVNIPLDKLQGQLSKFKGKKNIVVFCQSGGRSGQAKNFLDKNGIPNVFNGGPWVNVRNIVNG